jgi:putative hydrolase of the HAD superfamily
MTTIRALVFDLAGVLLDFGGVESLARMSDGRIGEAAFSRFWSRSEWADRLYRGRCSPEAFAAGAVHEFSLAVTPAAFLAEFQTWLRGPYPGALDLVRALRSQYRLACLSNTNALDVRRFREELRLHEEFDRCFFSNEIGLRKPEMDCYRHVVHQLECAPGEVAFFDDSDECVIGARRAGLHAYQCVGTDELIATIRRLDLAVS